MLNKIDHIIQDNKEKIVVSIIIMFIGVVLLKLFIVKIAKPAGLQVNIYNAKNTEYISNNISVKVDGEVNQPGTYSLNNGSRIVDLISKAGGITDYADMSNINVVQVLEDGYTVQVPKRTKYVTGKDKSLLININSANSDQLRSLPGLGKKYAQNIIEYREENGPFQKLSDIVKVKGIGAKRLKILEKHICL